MALIISLLAGPGAAPVLAAAPARRTSLESMTVADLLGAMDQWRLALVLSAAVVALALAWASDTIRAGSLQRAGVRDVRPYPWIIWLFCAAVAFLAWQLAAQFLVTQTWLTGPDPDALRAVATVGLGAHLIGSAAAAGLVYLLARTAPKAGLVFRTTDLLVGLACFAVAYPLVVLASDLAVLMHQGIAGVPPPPVAHESLQLIVSHRGEPWTWLLILSAVLGAPLIEELTYRVLLQSAILRASSSPWLAIVVTSAAFVLMHALPAGPGEAPAVPYYALVPLAVLGVSMGLAYERTKRLGVPLAMHMAFNTVNVVVALYTT